MTQKFDLSKFVNEIAIANATDNKEMTTTEARQILDEKLTDKGCLSFYSYIADETNNFTPYIVELFHRKQLKLFCDSVAEINNEYDEQTAILSIPACVMQLADIEKTAEKKKVSNRLGAKGENALIWLLIQQKLIKDMPSVFEIIGKAFNLDIERKEKAQQEKANRENILKNSFNSSIW